jgi:hypothetical protein
MLPEHSSRNHGWSKPPSISDEVSATNLKNLEIYFSRALDINEELSEEIDANLTLMRKFLVTPKALLTLTDGLTRELRRLVTTSQLAPLPETTFVWTNLSISKMKLIIYKNLLALVPPTERPLQPEKKRVRWTCVSQCELCFFYSRQQLAGLRTSMLRRLP